jgi:transcription elongation GreA/GreB family factor
MDGARLAKSEVLSNMMHDTSAVATPRMGGRVVEAGSRVRLRDDDGETELLVVEAADADATSGRVSIDSPLGRALLGQCAGEQVVVRAPAGRRVVSIVAIAAEVEL